jgi:hypothetical protein
MFNAKLTTDSWDTAYERKYTSLLTIQIIKDFYATFRTILLQENNKSIVACRPVAGRPPRDMRLYSRQQTTEEWCFLPGSLSNK